MSSPKNSTFTFTVTVEEFRLLTDSLIKTATNLRQQADTNLDIYDQLWRDFYALTEGDDDNVSM